MRHLYCDHRRVLVIDDNQRKLNLRAALLRNHEIEVDTANNPQDAESLWKVRSYDLVLLAQVNSEEAKLVWTQIREHKPHQRIGLLVGPPAYIQEVARIRKKPVVQPASVLATSLPLSSEPDSANPQWQRMVQRLVVDWYAARVLSVR